MRITVMAVVCWAALAQAQSINLNVGGFKAGVSVEAPAPQPVVVQQAPALPPPRVIGAEAFRVEYSLSQEPRLVVTQPEGLAAQVWSDTALAGQFVTPFSFVGRAGQFYRVILIAADGALVLDRKFELLDWKVATVSLARPPPVVVVAPPPAPVVVVQPPAPVVAPPPAVTAMPASEFSELLSAVRAEDFSSDKLGLVRSAVDGGAFFSCAQVGDLVDALDMSSDKVEVVQVTRARIVDPKNGFSLQRRFTFSSDKEKVRALLQ